MTAAEPPAILVVDDEPALLRIFVRWLAREGWRAATAANGVEALAVLRAQPVDAIVSDVRMPTMGGVELVRHLGTDGIPAPPVVLVSGFADLDLRGCLRLGATTLLPKPLERQDLVAAVRRALLPRALAWQAAPEPAPAHALDMALDGAAAAIAAGRFAIGRGGFAIATTLPVRVPATIGFRIAFAADGVTLAGDGIVQWVDATAGRIGIEIRSLEPEGRAWLLDRIARDVPTEFVP